MKKHSAPRAPIRSWASERLSPDIQRSLDRLARSDDVRHVAVMPDVHLAHNVCVGVAFATTQLLYPDAVGGDIGCGMAAIALNTPASSLNPDICRDILHALRAAVPIERQRRETADAHAHLLPPPDQLSLDSLQRLARNEGPIYLSTLGSGNHFLEVQRDESDQLWLMVHTGSRSLCQAIRAAHIKSARRSRLGLLCLDADTPQGAAYLSDVQWARNYAAANRRAILSSASAALHPIINAQPLDHTYIDADHNHVRPESHFAADHLIHRKGAMPAPPNLPGLVPGSMAAPSFHVTGKGLPDALHSSAHGAGRAMTREHARRSISRAQLSSELTHVHTDPASLSAMREEAPSVYKNIHDVMRVQRKLVRVTRTLTPILTHRALRAANSP